MNHADCVIKRDVYPQKMHSCSNNIPVTSFFVKKKKYPWYIKKKIYHRFYCMGIPLVER